MADTGTGQTLFRHVLPLEGTAEQILLLRTALGGFRQTGTAGSRRKVTLFLGRIGAGSAADGRDDSTGGWRTGSRIHRAGRP